ncbi:DUF2269 family protein [Bordetella sp. 2513F-2]
MDYLIGKWVHVISSTLLFGTGVGSAFYLLCASLQRNPAVVAAVARYVVIADMLFTATTAVLQPATGFYLLHRTGLPLSTPWVAWSLWLYVLAIGCWLPVVWLQVRLRDLAAQAAASADELPARYWRLFRWWVALGVPALLAFLAIFYLMIARPA